MGITQHANGVDNVTAIVNLALARGNVGRKGAGLMPIRGHSGVQGGSEMGAYATAFPGGVAVDEHDAPRRCRRPTGSRSASRPGLTAEAMVEAGARGQIDVLYSSGGNFLDVLPDPDFVRDALERVPVRVHQDIVVSSQMLVDPGEVVVLLPGVHALRAARRRHRDDDRAPHPVQPRDPGPADRRGAQRVGDLRRPRSPRPPRPRRTCSTSPTPTRCATRSPGSCPTYAGIEQLGKLGDAVQWGGTRLCADGEFPTPDGKAQFSPVAPALRERAGRPVRAQHPPGQAVQLDGLRRGRPAHRRAARRAAPRRAEDAEALDAGGRRPGRSSAPSTAR